MRATVAFAVLALAAWSLLYLADRYDLGRIVRFDDAAVSNLAAELQDLPASGLAARLGAQLDGPGSPVQLIDLDADGVLTVTRTLDVEIDGRARSGHDVLRVQLAELDALVYATSLTNGQRASDLWTIKVFCAHQAACLERSNDVWGWRSRAASDYLLAGVSGDAVHRVLALTHALLRAGGARHTIDYAGRGLAAIQAQYMP